MIRAVAHVSAEYLAARRRAGLDRRDEIWNGELHIASTPHESHQWLSDELGLFFKLHWEKRGLGKTRPATNVKRPGAPPAPEALGKGLPADFRIPDRSFLLPERYDRLQGGWIVGGPDAVLEIASPGDDTRDKLPFYFDVGVREVIVIDRDTRAVEVLRRGASAFEPAPSTADGWHVSEVLRTELRTEPSSGAHPTLRLRRTDEPERAYAVE